MTLLGSRFVLWFCWQECACSESDYFSSRRREKLGSEHAHEGQLRTVQIESPDKVIIHMQVCNFIQIPAFFKLLHHNFVWNNSTFFHWSKNVTIVLIQAKRTHTMLDLFMYAIIARAQKISWQERRKKVVLFFYYRWRHSLLLKQNLNDLNFLIEQIN